ncbi:MAG TPA: phosphatase PAP2 family protein [Saliniramus sp.]|nr:phosphatase PAP2 family protein [Saliniramus sp.]
MRHSLEPKRPENGAAHTVALVACTAGILLFAALGVLVVVDPALIEPTDEAIFEWLRSGATAKPEWFGEAVRDVSSLGSLSILIGSALIAAAYLLMLDRPGAALYVVVAAAGGIALGMGLKIPFDRARPDLLLHESRVFTRSFPSAHAAVSSAVLLTLAALVARQARETERQVFVLAAAVLIVFLIGISRIYLGVHWPSDVVAGWALGTAWACGCWLAFSASR